MEISADEPANRIDSFLATRLTQLSPARIDAEFDRLGSQDGVARLGAGIKDGSRPDGHRAAGDIRRHVAQSDVLLDAAAAREAHRPPGVVPRTFAMGGSTL